MPAYWKASILADPWPRATEGRPDALAGRLLRDEAGSLLSQLQPDDRAEAIDLGTVPGGDNHIGFAFDEAGCSPDWEQLEERAKALADRFPLDFSAIVHSLHEGAELRWAKKASCR